MACTPPVSASGLRIQPIKALFLANDLAEIAGGESANSNPYDYCGRRCHRRRVEVVDFCFEIIHFPAPLMASEYALVRPTTIGGGNGTESADTGCNFLCDSHEPIDKTYVNFQITLVLCDISLPVRLVQNPPLLRW